MSELLLDAAGRRRSPATLPDFHAGRPPRNKGMRYPADPPTIEEIEIGDGVHGRRLRGLIVVLWRAGLRIHEALALAEADLDSRRGSLLVRRGKGGRRREVGMDDWAWEREPHELGEGQCDALVWRRNPLLVRADHVAAAGDHRCAVELAPLFGGDGGQVFRWTRDAATSLPVVAAPGISPPGHHPVVGRRGRAACWSALCVSR